jgi:hypothetical protein
MLWFAIFVRGCRVKPMTVMWFSAGVSSAVATWLMRDRIDRLIYIHIDDQEDDTLRFLEDCERWWGRKVERLQSPLKCVENACRFRCYVNGVRGAACTRMLKREVRKQWEAETMFFNRFEYVWGMDATETKRCAERRNEMPDHDHAFPLVDHGVDKEEAHGILARAGIRRPRMYDLGFPNNNCRGCLKGGKGYWNLIRKVWPDVFALRAQTERLIGGTALHDKNGPIYLDELDPNAGRDEGPIVAECGVACEALANTMLVGTGKGV